MRDTIEVSTDLLERMAFESGREIDMGGGVAKLCVGHRTFVAPLPIRVPAQRVGTES